MFLTFHVHSDAIKGALGDGPAKSRGLGIPLILVIALATFNDSTAAVATSLILGIGRDGIESLESETAVIDLLFLVHVTRRRLATAPAALLALGFLRHYSTLPVTCDL